MALELNLELKNMDQVIWVDEKDNILGIVSREEAHQKGLLHRVSVVYLFNDNGQILIQHRSKKCDGRLDHSSAGHVDPNESYLESAQRELEEELGIKGIKLEEVAKDKSEANRPDGTIVKHQYTIYKCKGQPDKINKEEVQKVYWADPEEVLKDMEKDPKDIKYTRGFKVTIKRFLESI